MNYYNMQTGQTTNFLPTSFGDYHNLQAARDWDKYRAAGWRIIADVPTPDGQRVAGYEQSPDDPDYAVPIFEDIPPVPEPEPVYFPVGIEIDLLVLRTADGKAIGYVALSSGALEPIIYAHESPYDMPKLRAAIKAARERGEARIAAEAAERAAMRALIDAISGAATLPKAVRDAATAAGTAITAGDEARRAQREGGGQ
jgi:hypothetical protein